MRALNVVVYAIALLLGAAAYLKGGHAIYWESPKQLKPFYLFCLR